MESRSTPQAMQSYLKRGAQWLGLFRERKIEFVGEIQIDESELDALCLAIHQEWWGNHHREEFKAALTVATVNLAYFSSKDLETNRFPEYVLGKLHWRFQNQRFWEDEIGKPVTSLLERYFHTNRRSGPGRYTLPIKQQAGIPASVENQFLACFQVMIQRGLYFSEDNYQSFLAQIKSAMLDEFLQSDTGRRFCRDLVRIISNRFDGIFHEEAFPNQPRFKTILEKAWVKLQSEKPVITRRLPYPKLVLDLNSRQLAVEFSERGLNGSYCWNDGARVGRSLVFLQREDFVRGLSGWMYQPDSSRESWSIDPWQPTDHSWAAFRSGDHSYVGHQEKLSPGRYWLVLPEDISLSSPAQVFGKYGWLSFPANFEIFDCELPPGFEIPEVGLQVDSNLDTCPSLGFVANESLPFTHQVFISKLPELQIHGWNEEIPKQFFLLIDNGQRRESAQLTGAKFHCALPIPSQGEIRLEPKGRMPHGFQPLPLRYTLLPPDVEITWPTGLQTTNEQVIIRFQPAEDFRVCWEDKRLQKIHPACWSVPSAVEFVEGQASYQSGISFPLYGAIHRLKLTGQAIRARILWRESFSQKSRLELRLSPEEIGQQIEIGLVTHNNLSRTVTLTHPVPRSAMLSISTEEFRDAFADSLLVAAPIAIRLATPRSLRVLRTGVIYANEQKLTESLRNDDEQTICEWAELLPERLQNVVNSIRRLRVAPLPEFNIESEGLPEPLRRFVSCLKVCRLVSDGQDTSGGSGSLPDQDLHQTLGWFQSVSQLLGANQPHSSQALAVLRESVPNDLSAVPFERWRAACRNVHQRLLESKDWPAAIKEWGKQCQNGAWPQAKITQLGQMPGGSSLTDGARVYFYALERKRVGQARSQVMSWLGEARNKFEQAQQEAGQGITGEIATALRAMTFYHAENQAFRKEAQALIKYLSPQWSKLSQTLQWLQKSQTTQPVGNVTLGLADISPHPIDVELEKSIYE